jgi:hypothetical protein
MSNGKIAVLIPTKERLEDFIIFADSWMNTTEGKSDVIVGIDIGDETYEGIKDKYPFIYEYIKPKPFLDILNELALKYSDEYDYVGFMEDDCNFNTNGWEIAFINKIEEIGDNAIVWGNDLLNGESIVGLPFMNSKIIKKLGYMCPPEIKYLWADHFWKRIGQAVNSLYYFPEIVIEHRHYSTGKREKDVVSEHVDEVGKQDFIGFNQIYMRTNFNRDVQKLLI